MKPTAKIAQLSKIETDLKKQVTQLEEKRIPNTPVEVLARRRYAATQVVKRIEEAKKTCVKFMDDDQSQWIAGELNVVEENIMQIRNEMKQLPLEHKKVKTAEVRRLQQQTTALYVQQQQCEEKVE